MDYATLLVERSDDIATVTLNRPDVLNSLSSQLRAELLHFFRNRGDARVIVLTGAGRAFCAGQDLGDGKTLAAADIERVLREEYDPLLREIYECPLPVIAAVNGPAVGAGANLALGCDVVIATRSAYFAQAFCRIGLMPDAGGTYWLPRQIGFARAMGAALFGENVPADQAAEWGMIWEAVPDGEFASHIRKRALQLAKGPGVAYANVKAALRKSYDNTLDVQLDFEASLQGETGRTRDFLEGVTAFREKRVPKFEGR